MKRTPMCRRAAAWALALVITLSLFPLGLIQPARAAELPADITYYGDKSKCAMTAEQASELAQALQSWDGKGTMGPGEFFCTFLCDGDGSGLPVLAVVSQIYDPTWGTPAVEMLHIYNWKSGQLTKDELTSIVGDGVWGHHFLVFGTYADGSYGFNRDYGHMGYEEFTSYQIKSGALIEGDTYHIGIVDPYSVEPFEIEKNGQSVFTAEKTPDMDENAISALIKSTSDKYSELTDPYRLAETIDYMTGNSREEMIAALQAYAEAARVPTYTQPQAGTDDPYYDQVMQTVTAAQSGELETLYRLADGAYYAIVKNGDSFQGLLVQGKRQDGQVVWEVSRTDQEPVDQSALDAFVSSLLSGSNLELDFSRLSSSSELDSLLDYLRDLLDNMDGLTPNDPARSELASFLDGAVSALASGAVSGKNQRLEPTAKEVSALLDQARAALESFNSLLNEKNVSLPRTLYPTVRLFWDNADLSQACELMLTDELAETLGDGQIQILLGDGTHYIQISGSTLRSLVNELGSLSIQISKTGENTYDIRFLDGQGQVVERLSQSVTVAVPASGPLNTIMVSYAEGSDNWGGQYDPAVGIISFETPYSGRYEVLENNLTISDLEGLSDESREAISFLVSRGYMSLDGEHFRPADPLTRYEFTQALVGMFFALDRGASAIPGI